MLIHLFQFAGNDCTAVTGKYTFNNILLKTKKTKRP